MSDASTADRSARLAAKATQDALETGTIAMVVGSAVTWALHTAASRSSEAYRKGPAPLKRILFALATVGSFAAASHASSAASTYAANDLLMREMEERESSRRAQR